MFYKGTHFTTGVHTTEQQEIKHIQLTLAGFSIFHTLPVMYFTVMFYMTDRMFYEITESLSVLLVAIGNMFNCMLLASLCLMAAAMFDTEFDLPWEIWKKTHNKNYETQVGSNVTII